MIKPKSKKLLIKVSDKSKFTSNSTEYVRIKRKVIKRISRKIDTVPHTSLPIRKSLFSNLHKVLNKLPSLRSFNFWPFKRQAHYTPEHFEFSEHPGTRLDSQETASIEMSENSGEAARMTLQF